MIDYYRKLTTDCSWFLTLFSLGMTGSNLDSVLAVAWLALAFAVGLGIWDRTARDWVSLLVFHRTQFNLLFNCFLKQQTGESFQWVKTGAIRPLTQILKQSVIPYLFNPFSQLDSVLPLELGFFYQSWLGSSLFYYKVDWRIESLLTKGRWAGGSSKHPIILFLLIMPTLQNHRIPFLMPKPFFRLLTKVVIHTPEPETVSEAFTKPYERYSEAESHGWRDEGHWEE